MHDSACVLIRTLQYTLWQIACARFDIRANQDVIVHIMVDCVCTIQQACQSGRYSTHYGGSRVHDLTCVPIWGSLKQIKEEDELEYNKQNTYNIYTYTPIFLNNIRFEY